MVRKKLSWKAVVAMVVLIVLIALLMLNSIYIYHIGYQKFGQIFLAGRGSLAKDFMASPKHAVIEIILSIAALADYVLLKFWE